MKKLILPILSGLIILTGCAGCASLSSTDVTRIASASKQAAFIGTQEVLLKHPEWRPYFVSAQAQLQILATSPQIGVQDILNIAAQLPVKELKSDTARISFEAATFAISAINVPEVPAERLAQLQPIAQAMADGIAQGLK